MIYLLWKTKGQSSFQAIKTFARQHNIKKIGHTGTLDPLASGLLLVATNESTTLIPFLDQKYGTKTYLATLELSKSSDTYDIEGKVINHTCNHHHNAEEIATILKHQFTGSLKQMPPIFSAKKINGKKAYELARKGVEVNLKPQNIFVEQAKLMNWDSINLKAEILFTVSKGAYIRTLIHDLGKALKCNAIMTDLIRNQIGELTLVQEEFQQLSYQKLLPWKSYEVSQSQLKDFYYGKISMKNLVNHSSWERVWLTTNTKIFGIGKIDPTTNLVFPEKLFGKIVLSLLENF
ncbi:tRNA pseudouridine(55) synthase TruB [Candidatus Mycoplasma pogonae]